jgi:hypothetical protein
VGRLERLFGEKGATIPLFEKQGFTLAGSSSTAKLQYRKPLN